MTITVAMALSGLEPEQWNDGLKEIYMQGAILFPKSPSTLSIASSGASSYYSLESGISSMSPDSASYLNQFIINDLDGLGLDGMVQLQEMKDDDGSMIDLHCQTAASTSTFATVYGTTTVTDANFEIRIALPRKLKPSTVLLEALDQNNKLYVSNCDTYVEGREEGMKPNKAYTQVMYKGRNVLDLFSNINGGWKYQTSALPEGINSSYFDNRSQYSRLQDAYPPKHAKAACKDKDCAFVETIYF